MTQPIALFRRSFKTYYNLVISMLVFLMFILFIASIFYDVYIQHAPVSPHFLKKWLVMLIFSSMIVLIAIIFGIKELWKLIESTEPITFSDDHLSIGKSTIPFLEIKEIKTIALAPISMDHYWGGKPCTKKWRNIFYTRRSFVYP